MRAFFVDRSFNPQVVMIGGAGEHLRFDQKPRQIEFSAGHIKSMVRDAKERENPVGYDCEGYAKAIADGTEKNISLCVPGKAETEDVLEKLVAGTYSFA
jgi:hypothetical protein